MTNKQGCYIEGCARITVLSWLFVISAIDSDHNSWQFLPLGLLHIKPTAEQHGSYYMKHMKHKKHTCNFWCVGKWSNCQCTSLRTFWHKPHVRIPPAAPHLGSRTPSMSLTLPNSCANFSCFVLNLGCGIVPSNLANWFSGTTKASLFSKF